MLLFIVNYRIAKLENNVNSTVNLIYIYNVLFIEHKSLLNSLPFKLATPS